MDESGTEIIEKFELVYVVEGQRDPCSLPIHPHLPVDAILALIRDVHPDAEITHLSLEDDEEILGNEVRIVERLVADFKIVHAAKNHHIAVTVEYGGATKHHDFRPSVTVRAVIEWAIGAFDLTDPANKFVLKHDGQTLEPETHLGQLTAGACSLTVVLTHSKKHQG